jgi:methyl-accepting chemotaxis protein PixJ
MTNQFNRAITLFTQGLRSSKLPSRKALLFGDITSQSHPVDLDYLYKRTVDGAREILGTDRVIIYVFDTDWNGTIAAESIAPQCVPSLGDQIVDTCLRDSKGGSYNNGRVRVINDIYQAGLSDCHIKMLEKYQIKANLVAPILKDDKLFALLIAHQCDQPRVWQADEIDFFVQLAALISLRLGRANFLEQIAKAGQVRSFANVALRIRESLELEDVFNTAAKEIRQILNADRVLICRLSPSLQDGTIVAESVVPACPQMLGLRLHELPATDQHPVMAHKSSQVYAISNVLKEPELTNTDITLTEKYKVKASLVAPIHAGDQLVGLLIAHQCSQIRTWEQPTIDLFRNLADQVGLVVEQATLLKSVEAEAERTQLLADFTSRIRQSFNSQDIFSTSVEEIRNVLETDRVLIYRFNPDGTGGEITAQSVAPDWAPAQGKIINELFKEETFQGYKSDSFWVTHDVDKADLTPSHSKLREDLQVKASIVAPIQSGNKFVGFLCVHQCSGSRDWQQSEFYLLKQLAAQIGFALDQANLIKQLNIVSTRQQQQTEELRHQLVSLIKDLQGAAQGDLTVHAEAKTIEVSIVADFFNVIIKSLQKIVTQVKLATTQVNASLGENEGAILQLADIAFKQAQETTRTLDSVERMSRSIQEVADSAYHAAEVARTVSATAQSGGEAMDRTVEKILNLRETVVNTAKKVKGLGESSQEISKVVSLINQIATQTNLLAINAGIEARRAGEENKGFVVVAKQIGELAVRAAAGTQEIEQIVENIQKETSHVVEAMELGRSQVVEGTHLVEQTKQSLGRLLEVSHQIDALVQSISKATVSQAETSCALTDLMKEMVIVSEQTSKSSHQISGSLQQTVAVAQQLQASVEVFKVETTNTHARN